MFYWLFPPHLQLLNLWKCICKSPFVRIHRLNFDNSAYRYIMKEDEEEQEILPITSDFFFEVFPFNIVFRQVITLSCTCYYSTSSEGMNTFAALFYSLGHGGAQRGLRTGYSLSWSRWKEDQRCLPAGSPPGGVHLEHGETSFNSMSSSYFQPVQFQDEDLKCQLRFKYWFYNLYTDYLPPQQSLRDYVQGACEEREESSQPSPE